MVNDCDLRSSRIAFIQRSFKFLVNAVLLLVRGVHDSVVFSPLVNDLCSDLVIQLGLAKSTIPPTTN